jgi:hypothetical protein
MRNLESRLQRQQPPVTTENSGFGHTRLLSFVMAERMDAG